MEEREIKSGVSPFIYRERMKIVNEDFRGVSEDYYLRCLRTGRLNGYDTDILEELYKYGYLNSHMLQVFFDKTYTSLKHRLAKLKRNGFIVGYWFEYISVADETEKTIRTAPFYGLSESVRRNFNGDNLLFHLPVFTDPINVLKILARNAFIIDCLVLDRFYPERVVKRMPGFESKVASYSFKAGYGIILKTKTDTGNVCFVPITARRENNWQDVLIPNLKIILGAMIPEKANIVIPVIICEDYIHMVQIRKEIAKDEKIRNLNICYVTDMTCGNGDIFNDLLVYGKTDIDGEPVFTKTEFI